ncbi:Possible sterol desaturase [uncultured Candidatus Thioglobus sp.]|nr:Possible sterol desaturase [uncultured Candidatus Thioglobus sp.]
MEQFLLDHAALLRLSAFLVVLVLFSTWEFYRPCRSQALVWYRRFNNLLLLGVGAVLVRYLFPLAMVGVAQWYSLNGWGLYTMLGTSFWVSLVSFVLLMDLVIYAQHVMMHKIPLLWRLHRVHHSDRHLDVTTALRFHPLEIIFSVLLKCLVIAMLGPPVIAVVVFIVGLNIISMFNHSNVYINPTVDRYLRYFLVTPDVHCVHHSMDLSENRCNYGFNLPWWDYLFGTYQARPARGYQSMQIGLSEFSGTKIVGVFWLLIMPFLSDKADTEKDI